MTRPTKTEYYLDIAEAVAKRSTCLRRQYGAVIVKNDRIISTGYNGAAKHRTNCCDVGECERARLGIPHGERYEKCVAVHAEANAIIQASADELEGSTLYLVGIQDGVRMEHAEPCEMCWRLIYNAGINMVRR